jgi:FADH2 O2-dependent halogenase
MHHDVAILGAGFGGSIAALIAKQMGMNPVLIEKGSHPRFAIGESSTPQADIALQHIAEKYNLPRLKPLVTYGTWKETYPDLSCGPKRGFTYIHHGSAGGELLIAANASQYEADTHWYRADVDNFFVNEVKQAGIPYFDSTDVKLTSVNSWKLSSENFSCTADFLIDATGGANPLGIPQDLSNIQTNSRVLFAHFTGVTPWGELHGKPEHPYPCHDAALHHVFSGGWMYVLHFDNGITSAGFVLDMEKRPCDTWESLMNEFPLIREQFQHAERSTELVLTNRIQRCATSFVGENWAMLPNAAYCIDPLHSTGNAHTLCCVDRLMQSFGNAQALRVYESTMREEIVLIDQLVRGSYACMHDFDSFANYVMLYFAGADFSERKRRSNQRTGFLNSQDEKYKSTVALWYTRAVSGQTIRNLANDLEPWNMVGLCDPTKQNMYDYA